MPTPRQRLLLMGRNPSDTSILCTTVAAATLTIAALTVSAGKTLVVNWGDGSTDSYTGAGARTHNYAGAGTFKVRFLQPTYVTVFNVTDAKVTLNSRDVKQMKNITNFQASSINAGTFNSSDVSAWRPTTFYLYSMPTGYAGTFNSSDVSAWRPTYFYLYSMPTGYAGTFNSSDVSAWRPAYFYLYNMPAGYAGTFNSSDVSAWRPEYFYLLGMPAGYAGTFNSTNVSAWRPAYFYLYNMPVATYTITITASGFAAWVSTSYVSMQNNSLTQVAVDQILSDLWTAFATRTVAAGTINVAGTNAAPSGLLQAANPPTTGKERAYELVNDTGLINPTKKWTTVTITA